MKRIVVTESIQSQPERVFHLASDIPNVPNYQPAITKIEMLTPLPVGVGTRWKETRKAMGKEATVELEITKFDPPASYTVEFTYDKTRFITDFTVKATEQGSEARFDMQIVSQGFMAGLMAGIVTGAMRSGLADDLAALKRAAEQVS